MKKYNSDYIPSVADQMREAEQRREMIKNMPNVRKTYECKYNVNGTPITEKVLAVSSKYAEEHVRQQCSMVGWIPADLKVRELEDNNIEVK